SAPVRWLRHRRTYRRLSPLWHALAEAMPQIVLPRGGLDRFSYRYGVHRRVIEIRDGLLLLRPYCDPVLRDRTETTADGFGPPGPQSAALQEAITIRKALAAYQSRRPATRVHESTTGGTTGPPAGDQVHDPGNSVAGADLESEAEWLMQVSSAFTIAALTVDTTEDAPSGCR
ncbi:MAB_1171c family putative transporter, partial [Actinomadura adrarensis]